MSDPKEKRLKQAMNALEKRVEENWRKYRKLHKEICEGESGYPRNYAMDEILEEQMQLKRVSQILEWAEKEPEIRQEFPSGLLNRPDSITIPYFKNTL